MKSAREALAMNRREAMDLARHLGVARTRRLLEGADRDLQRRLREAVRGPGAGSFTHEQLKATLAQVREVLRDLQGGMKRTIVAGADEVSDAAAAHVVDYLEEAHRAFRVGRQPLALKEAALFDVAREGARASVLRRLASSGEPVAGADDEPHPAKLGVLDRYGVNTIGNFEEVLQRGIVTRKPLAEVRAELVSKSPFLQGAPASWAERIVRTETMSVYGRASWESMREADDQLGDMVKILSAVVDDRTGPDSLNTTGEVRRPDEAFEYVDYRGAHVFFMHPPDRPNDRSVVVPHRLSWGQPPPYLQPLPTSAVVAAYTRAKQRYHGRPHKISSVKFARS